MQALRLMEDGRITVIISNRLRVEYEEILSHPAQQMRFPFLTAEYVAIQMERFDVHAQRIANPPTRLTYPRDPKDEHILNLVIEARLEFLVTLDKDLLALSQYLPFRAVVPQFQSLRPGPFLGEMASRQV